MIEALREIMYFREFNDEDMQKLVRISHVLKKNNKDILFYEGDVPSSLYILIRGKVQLLKMRGGDKQLFLHMINAPSLIAELTIFDMPRYPASAEAMSDIEVIAIDLKAFSEQFLEDKRILKLIIKSLGAKVKFLMRTLEQESALNLESKVAKFLRNNQEVLKDYKNIKIANILNMPPETLSRILTKLKKNGTLISSRPIVIADIEKLKKY